jgi:hypothetical protein
MFPANMKKGIASRGKLSRPLAILWANVVKAGRESMDTSIVRMPEIPMLNAIGTPSDNRIMKLKTKTSIPT